MGYGDRGKGGRRYRYIPAEQIGLKISCRAPICRNERDRVCRGGGWWRLQESPRLSLAGGPGGKSGAVVRERSEREERDHPSHHYDMLGHPPSRPSLANARVRPRTILVPKGRAETGWQGAGDRLDRGGRGVRVRWADGQGRGGTGIVR